MEATTPDAFKQQAPQSISKFQPKKSLRDPDHAPTIICTRDGLEFLNSTHKELQPTSKPIAPISLKVRKSGLGSPNTSILRNNNKSGFNSNNSKLLIRLANQNSQKKGFYNVTRGGSTEHQGYLMDHRCDRDQLDSQSGCVSNMPSKQSESEVGVGDKSQRCNKKKGTITNQLLKRDDSSVKRPKNYSMVTKAPSAFSGVLPVLVREGSLLCSGRLNTKLVGLISSIPNSDRNIKSKAGKGGLPIEEKQFFTSHDRGASYDGNFNSNSRQNRGSIP